MSLKILTLTACLTLSACVKPALTDGTWRGAVENGDKPGIGIELTQTGSQITGRMFILDPNRPGDFKSGREFPMKISRITANEIKFAVDFGQGHPEEDVLRLYIPLAGTQISTYLQTAAGKDEPRKYLLTKVTGRH